jgi:uncharacterized caspase-like protein
MGGVTHVVVRKRAGLAGLLALGLSLLNAPAALAQRNLEVTQSTVTEQRIALVIGNGAYKNTSPLANPPNDARLMAETLASLGFRLISGRALVNTDKSTMERAIREFGQRLRGGAVGLFYYAGHGVQVRGENYLIPVGAQVSDEADVKYELVSASLVLEEMAHAGNRLNLVILDACRNNPFGARGLRSASSGLAQVNAPAGTIISYATQPGNTAADGDGRNSPYTAALAAAMKRPGLGLFETFNQVGLAVSKATGGRQQPWLATSPVEGSFQFTGGSAPTPGSASSAVAVPAPVIDASVNDRAFWESVRDSSNPSELNAYLTQYPAGLFASLAKSRLSVLSAPQASVPPPTAPSAPASQDAAELVYWSTIKDTRSAAELKAFLEKFPRGTFTALARSRLIELEPIAPDPERATLVLMTNLGERADGVWRYSTPGSDIDVRPGTYRVLRLRPGEYTFDLSIQVRTNPPEYNHRDKRTFVLSAGQVMYLRAAFRGVFGNQIVELPPADGLRLSQKLALSNPETLESRR